MNFAENLRTLRKQRGLSQEELAGIMDVSRQAVSKWEQGEGYPEVEKLLLLSGTLGVSLDSLMGMQTAGAPLSARSTVANPLTITSPHESVVATCRSVLSSQRFRGGKDAPRYALFGTDTAPRSFFGPSTVFLGWYADRASIESEIAAITEALSGGASAYTLRYSVKVRRRWLGMKIVCE